MKKILLLFILSLPSVLYSQDTHFVGSGTVGDPYSGGTLGGTSHHDESWSGTIYVSGDLTIGDYGHLTIDAGTTIKFTSAGTDLFIKGTGQITANGTSGSKITFTADYDNDGHEAGETWGHISFQNMTGTPASSTFDYCIFEYGYSTGGSSQPLLAGGAIQIDFNDVVITNCIFRNNYASYAGAVMVNSSRNAIIKNSYFESNDAYECGGALILYTNSTALVENCIFFDNYSKGNSSSGYSGGAIWSYSNTSKIVNCTFVENTSDRAGDAIYSYSSSGMRIINSILWGSSDQFAGATTTSTIVTCAFESAKPANAANSIIISDVANDHFVDAGSGDWTLKFISPCRDAGTNSYGSPNIIPTTDYIGKSTIGTKDIGTYEVQYSRWTGAASNLWATASNWDKSVDPATGTGDVIIPTGLTNYPTGSSSQDYTIGTGKGMVIEQGACVTLNALTNNGILKLDATSAGFASLIINSYTKGGGATEEIQLYLSGGGSEGPPADYKWHYISSPVSSISTGVFTGVTLDLAQFIESRPALSLLQGWVAYDGYEYSYGTFTGITFASLTPGKGYNFWDGSNNTFTFGGTFNTSDVVMSLPYSGDPSAMHGFNLLGNPFSSGLDWDVIVNDVGYPSYTSKGLYFTRDNTQCTYIGGVGTPGDVTGIIPPMQGFFTKTYSTGNTITLPAAARTHNNIHARYKGSTIIPLVRLLLKRDSASSDETVVRFDDQAKSDLDNDFDAIKMFISATRTQIWSSLGGTDYAINGQPFPGPGTYVEIPIVINLIKDTIHTISATQLQGLDNYNVTLKDNTTGFTADLKTTPVVTFSAGTGTITGRFVLKVSTITTGTEIPLISRNTFNIYPANNFINIQTMSDDWDGKTGSVRLLDITGKTVNNKQDAEFSKNSLLQVPAPVVRGIYIVELKSGLMRYVVKIIIR